MADFHRFRDGVSLKAAARYSHLIPAFALAAAVSACAENSEHNRRQQSEEATATLSANPDRVLFGDLHLHSNLSFDAYTFGNTGLSPEQAYRFARGEEVTSSTGLKAKLKRPLDFLMVSDHAEYLGLMPAIVRDDPLIQRDKLAQRWKRYLAQKRLNDVISEFVALTSGQESATPLPEDFTRSIWGSIADIADKYNEPGKFTTFIGYEWSAMRSGDNLHRVVVFADDASTATKVRPFSALESADPERLWEALGAYESQIGGSVLAIPHNGNLSDGAMFADATFKGAPLSRSYRETRRKFEPLAEVTQVKGDGESHPLLSPEDAFADFETWDEFDLGRNPRTEDPEAKRKQLQGEYVRSALKKGLNYASDGGANPFEFGMIGSTDMHTGLSAAGEDNFFGKFSDSEPSASRMGSAMGGALWANSILSASGYVGVWARANTRAEIFAALKRREVYATTGPRIRLRFFAGWDYPDKLAESKSYVDVAYARGVPMGSVLTKGTSNGKAPSFMVVATKDPDGANLDRIQIVKGWRDNNGQLHEQVYDVALSDERRVDLKTGKAPPVGNTVNLKDATYTNSIGAVELRTVWRDPDFDPAEQAFYYARVLQIPTPRWTSYDAAKYDLAIPKGIPATIQDRAYSSPIWYYARQH